MPPTDAALPEEISRLFAPPRPGRGAWAGSVAAAVLTYDRKETLRLCLAALRQQTAPPDRIIIVDNASTDGTDELLRAEGWLDDPRVLYVRLERNIGASGGFARLFREVWRSGADWGWFMDDDLVPAPDALAALKRAYAEHFTRPEEVGFLVANQVTPDGKVNDVPIVDDRAGAANAPEWCEHLAAGLVRVRSCALNAVLIPRATLARFGAPCVDFVVWGEDTDYCLRVTEERPAYLVGQARAVHLRAVAGDLDILTEPEGPRVARFYYLYRNTMYLRRRFWPLQGRLLFIAKALRDATLCLAAPRHGWRRAALVLRGTLAGLCFTPRYVPLEASAGGAAALGRADQRPPGHGARLLEAEER